MIKDKVEKKVKRKIEKYSKRRYDKECMKLAKAIVRLRDLDTCQKCWKPWPWLHCSHVMSDWKDTRLSVDPMNMKLLCYRDHFHYWHKHPLDASEWFKEKFPERYEYLVEKYKEPKTGSIELSWREETYKNLTETLESIKELHRKHGLN